VKTITYTSEVASKLAGWKKPTKETIGCTQRQAGVHTRDGQKTHPSFITFSIASL